MRDYTWRRLRRLTMLTAAGGFLFQFAGCPIVDVANILQGALLLGNGLTGLVSGGSL